MEDPYSPGLWCQDAGIVEDIFILLHGVEKSLDALEPFSLHNRAQHGAEDSVGRHHSEDGAVLVVHHHGSVAVSWSQRYLNFHNGVSAVHLSFSKNGELLRVQVICVGWTIFKLNLTVLGLSFPASFLLVGPVRFRQSLVQYHC